MSDYGRTGAELERIWNEEVMTQSRYYPETCLERRRKALEGFSQYIRCAG
jgi:hypothetical protein